MNDEENNDLTKKEEYTSFIEDMDYVLSLLTELNLKFSEEDNESFFYLKKLRNTIDRFNKKYEGVYAAVKKTVNSAFLKFYLKKESINKVFDEFIREDSFLKERIFNNKASLPREFNQNKNINSNISEMIALKKNKNFNMIELIYRENSLKNHSSPEFRLLVSHVMSHKIIKEINIRLKED